MSSLVTGFAIIIMMASGFVWGRSGIGWMNTGHWRSISVNDTYGYVFHRQLIFSDGFPGDWIQQLFEIDMGMVLLLFGLAIFFLAARSSREA